MGVTPGPGVSVARSHGHAVVGAHLSGMGLNHELTARGATFVKEPA